MDTVHLRTIREAAVPYLVHYANGLTPLPLAARPEIERTMRQIADAVGTLPPASPFWTSMEDSVVQIDVAGFRVVYRVEPGQSVVRVIELQKLP